MINKLNIFEFNNTLEPIQGRILIAEPLLRDELFSRTVILINENSADGHLGFILNKTANISLGNVLPNAKGINFPVYLGGPIATSSLHFIHKHGLEISNSIKITKNIYWGGDIHDTIKLIKNNVITTDSIRFFLGYSGWDEDQLDEEIKLKSWVVSDIQSLNLFNNNLDEMWKLAVNNLDNNFKKWLSMPKNIKMN